MTGTMLKLQLRNQAGRLREVEFADHGPFDSPGSALRQRLVSAGDNSFVLKSVPRAANGGNGHLFDLLDNEIRAGARLGHVYPGRYPAELARLAGYNVDVEEPFALLHAYAGKPVAEMSGLDDHRRRQVQIGLLRALQATAAAGVVHGAVSLRSLWFSAAGVQLVDFESAQWAGEPRRAAPEPGPVDVRDDVLLAGRVIRQLVLGESSATAGHDHDPESLRTLLTDVFRPAANRPYAEDLLRRLKVPVTLPPARDPEAVLAEGRRAFDTLGVQPHPSPPAGDGPGGPSGHVPGRKRGVWRRFLTPMLLVTTVAQAGRR